MMPSELAPSPDPLPLPEGYDRHDPTTAELREAMTALAGERDWTRLTWAGFLESLVALGRTDIPLSRLVEGHVDALRILAEASVPARPDQLYAVWASRSHATGVTAQWQRDGLVLSGTLRFASGAGLVDRALVPVWLSEDRHLLLDVAVEDWPVDTSTWRTAAMAVSRSHTITLDGASVPSSACVGEECFYLGRPGFFLGGVGVAAVWAGGAARLTDLAVESCRAAPPSAARDQRLGDIRTELATAQAVILAASRKTPPYDGGSPRVLATEVRAAVAGAVRRLVAHARDLAGPAGLAYDLDLTRGIDDLDLYVRQQNPVSDAGYLGGLPG
ncbi:acyl-CoA/acyl-ACP dehydrogenase [Segeticoccus rhizosphaerae]|uniref:acyl-CoA/acyl-ACP dehydrogenase n=1 Tax=Segeticoccus rhizosphaerae TaxID=1104777 RepID=UPI0010C06026|nr:acyl-CoA/acyl-ACP dehydrogenase [Ornithinicoccus soli]